MAISMKGIIKLLLIDNVTGKTDLIGNVTGETDLIGNATCRYSELTAVKIKIKLK